MDNHRELFLNEISKTHFTQDQIKLILVCYDLATDKDKLAYLDRMLVELKSGKL